MVIFLIATRYSTGPSGYTGCLTSAISWRITSKLKNRMWGERGWK
jgi:hypothetical protein